MKHRQLAIGIAAGALLSTAVVGFAHADCRHVDGRINSDLVAFFSDGSACPSPLGLCTEGRFSGDLKGRFRFVADSLSPYVLQDPASPADVVATTGTISLRTKYCGGTLFLRDTSAFSTSADGLVGGLETVDGDASSGGCAGASGRIHVAGVFMEGCINCRYEGEVCRVGGGADDDSDSEDD